MPDPFCLLALAPRALKDEDEIEGSGGDSRQMVLVGFDEEELSVLIASFLSNVLLSSLACSAMSSRFLFSS